MTEENTNEITQDEINEAITEADKAIERIEKLNARKNKTYPNSPEIYGEEKKASEGQTYPNSPLMYDDKPDVFTLKKEPERPLRDAFKLHPES